MKGAKNVCVGKSFSYYESVPLFFHTVSIFNILGSLNCSDNLVIPYCFGVASLFQYFRTSELDVKERTS